MTSIPCDYTETRNTYYKVQILYAHYLLNTATPSLLSSLVKWSLTSGSTKYITDTTDVNVVMANVTLDVLQRYELCQCYYFSTRCFRKETLRRQYYNEITIASLLQTSRNKQVKWPNGLRQRSFAQQREIVNCLRVAASLSYKYTIRWVVWRLN
jgi:hypothetical protein